MLYTSVSRLHSTSDEWCKQHCIVFSMHVQCMYGARNKDQKLVSRFLKIGYFIGYYTAVPLKMYGKYGR